MTRFDSCDDDSRFDRLVDGELPPTEYREMLTQLDDEPGGWRRCALAFLEAQAWRSGLTALRDERVGTTPREPATLTVAAARPWNKAFLAAAMAACFLMAVGLGTLLPPLRIAPVVDNGAPGGAAIAESPSQGADGGAALADAALADALPVERAPLIDGPRRGATPRNVTLVVDGNGAGPHEVDVPVFDWNDVDADIFAADRTAIAPEIQDLIERSGHQVLRERRLVPVDLGDGRQVVVPIEDVRIVPQGRPPP
ncbi:MAG: hypothetical protein KDA41_20530 [Planctomycetales bacterium]|nr:hypothetical protein [Planctomycetales bacterium]